MLASHPAVAECAVIGVHDELKGQMPRGFVVLKAGVSIEPRPCGRARRSGPRKDRARSPRCDGSTSLPRLPKTRSGKILRKTMRGIADGRDEAAPSTIEDLSVLDALRPILTDRSS